MVAGQATVDSITNPDEMFKDAGINLIKDKVDKLDAKNKTITTSEGKELNYDKLALTPGSSPVVPPISGSHLNGVHTLRDSNDAKKIQQYIKENRPKNLVFVGAGFINLELAALLNEENPGEFNITIVELLKHPLPVMLDSEMGEKVSQYLNEQGFNLKLQQKVTEIKGDDNQVSKVILENGEELAADMVMLSVGTKPNLELAKEAGLEIGDIGVKVNNYLETSDPNILAAGDIIETNHVVSKKPSPSLLRGPAVIQGRLMAKRLAGYDISFPGILNNSAVRLLDKHISATGLNEDLAKQEGFNAVGMTVDSKSKHSMIPGALPWTLKLVFDKDSEKLLGGQIISDDVAPAKEIDNVNALILGEMTASQMSVLMCAGNPDLSSEPSSEPITLASDKALQLINQ